LQGQELIHEDYANVIPESVWTNDFVGVQHFDTYEDLTEFILQMQSSENEKGGFEDVE
jgi:hypothetical protein